MRRYVVLLRYGLSDLRAVLKVERAADGTVTCWNTVAPRKTITWRPDGQCRESSDTAAERQGVRSAFLAIREPQVGYSVPGPRLLDAMVPEYDSHLDAGATVQISGHAVLEEPDRVALQLVLVPRGEEPYHRETVGDRRIDEGQPDLWIVLDRADEPPLRVVAVLRVPSRPHPLRAQAAPPNDPLDP